MNTASVLQIPLALAVLLMTTTYWGVTAHVEPVTAKLSRLATANLYRGNILPLFTFWSSSFGLGGRAGSDHLACVVEDEKTTRRSVCGAHRFLRGEIRVARWDLTGSCKCIRDFVCPPRDSYCCFSFFQFQCLFRHLAELEKSNHIARNFCADCRL